MKVLIVDRDEIVADMIRSKLVSSGNQVVQEPSKNSVIERVAKDEFDLIFLDPSPLTSPRPVILNIRRAINNYAYIVLLSDSISQVEAVKSGANDLLGKPLDSAELDQKIKNAERLTALVTRIGDDSEDFPSAGGVIAKSAFNQLFLSAMDRADRYGEKSYILFIGISNYKEIKELDGSYAAEYAVAKLSQYLVLLRRQSDIIGQTAKHEYALLLQRPVYETEPVEAASRFIESIQKYDEIISSGSTPVEITVSLVEVPTGLTVVEQVISGTAS